MKHLIPFALEIIKVNGEQISPIHLKSNISNLTFLGLFVVHSFYMLRFNYQYYNVKAIYCLFYTLLIFYILETIKVNGEQLSLNYLQFCVFNLFLNNTYELMFYKQVSL